LFALGIDFGTSNCTAYIADGTGKIIPVPLEDESTFLPSMVFTARREIALRQVSTNELSKRLRNALAENERNARNGEKKLEEAVLRKSIENAMKLEIAQDANREYWDQSFFSTLENGQTILYGTSAINAYMEDPLSGLLVKSPKSFLGSNVNSAHFSKFQDVISTMLAHIKRKAEALVQSDISKVIIGRPVNYHGISGQEGNNQALKIMEDAARSAGFGYIQFFMEPVAAALEFERSVTKETIALVIDIGGGTTDCAVVKVGPDRIGKYDRDDDVLAYSGDRVGGTDFDESIAWENIMPLFGKDVKTSSGGIIPNSILADAISTRNVPAQLRFGRVTEGKIAAMFKGVANDDLKNRLLQLHEYQLQHRLIHSAELAKMKLSNANLCTVPLNFIEDDLVVSISEKDFVESTERLIHKIEKIVREVPWKSADAIFITGGMGSSPILQARLKDIFKGDASIQFGDMLGSVGKGLGYCATHLAN